MLGITRQLEAQALPPVAVLAEVESTCTQQLRACSLMGHHMALPHQCHQQQQVEEEEEEEEAWPLGLVAALVQEQGHNSTCKLAASCHPTHHLNTSTNSSMAAVAGTWWEVPWWAIIQ